MDPLVFSAANDHTPARSLHHEAGPHVGRLNQSLQLEEPRLLINRNPMHGGMFLHAD